MKNYEKKATFYFSALSRPKADLDFWKKLIWKHIKCFFGNPWIINRKSNEVLVNVMKCLWKLILFPEIPFRAPKANFHFFLQTSLRPIQKKMDVMVNKTFWTQTSVRNEMETGKLSEIQWPHDGCHSAHDRLFGLKFLLEVEFKNY